VSGCGYREAVPTEEEIQQRRRDWAEQAEIDFAEIVPRAFFPWWANLAFASMVASGVYQLAAPAVSVAVAAVLFAWGATLRRGPRPTVVRFWSAVILAIAAFLASLIVYLDRDSPLLAAWASCSAAGLTYLLVMTLRPSAFARPFDEG